MATITPTRAEHPGPSYLLTWETMGNDDTGTAVKIPGAADKTVTVTGTFGGATVTLQGSNDNTNWFTLTDPQGNDIAFTAAGMEIIMENPLWIRAITVGGSGTDVDVLVLARSTVS